MKKLVQTDLLRRVRRLSEANNLLRKQRDTLLEACKFAMEWTNLWLREQGPAEENLVNTLRAAIANAEGCLNEKAVNSSVDAAQELLDQLQTTNVNIGLIHSEQQERHDCASGVDSCDCPLAINWRHNQAVIAKAGRLNKKEVTR